MKRWKRFWLSPRAEKQLFFLAWISFGYYFLWVHLLPSKRLRKYFQNHSSAYIHHLHFTEIEYALMVQQAIRRLMVFLSLKNQCLAYALTARYLLHRKTINSELYLGVRKEQQKLKAHAWVICNGLNIVGGEGTASYSVIGVFRQRY